MEFVSTLHGQNPEFLVLKTGVYIVTTGI